MISYFEKNKIKKALLQGGLVIANRGSGKTEAILEILMEDSNAIAIVHTSYAKDRFFQLLNSKYPGVYSKNELNKKIISSYNAEEKLKGLHRDVYVDEYFLCNYKGPFKAAVSS